jgi:hypothetical protein
MVIKANSRDQGFWDLKWHKVNEGMGKQASKNYARHEEEDI